MKKSVPFTDNDIEKLPTVRCAKCGRDGWLVDQEGSPPMILHAVRPEDGEAIIWHDCGGEQ